MRRRRLILVTVLTLLALAVGVTVWAVVVHAQAHHATGYEALGCASIAGWDWLRATDARATWLFDPAPLAGGDLGKVYLNFAGLVTNGTDGGAGYSATLRFKVGLPDSTPVTVSVGANNPFRPQNSANSGGVGYATYGSGGPLPATMVRLALERKVPLKVMLTWSSDTVTPVGRHVAVKRDSVFLGYLK